MKKEERRLFSHRFKEESIFVHTTDAELNPWDRTRIVTVLVNETGIDYQLADKISEEIQAIIFSSELKVVTSELVRELVNAKLVEHRFEQARERNRRLGLSLYDVGNLLRYPTPLNPEQPGTPAGAGAVMADTMKRQFALSEIFPPPLHRLHLEGRFHIHGLAAPDRPLMAWLNAVDLLNFQYAGCGTIISRPDTPDRLLQNLLKMDTLVRGMVHERVTWFNLEAAFRAIGTDPSDMPSFIGRVLTDREVLGRLPGHARTGLHLQEPGSVAGAAAFLDGRHPLSCDLLAEPEAWESYPWLRRVQVPFTDTTFIMEAVTLNLPGLGIRSVVEDEPVENQLNQLLDKAVSVIGKRRVYLEKLAAVKPDGPLDLLVRFGFRPSECPAIIGVCGLNELIRVRMDGDMDHNTKRQEAAFQILKTLKDQLATLSEKRNLQLLLGTANQMEAAYRFARLDLKFQPYYAARILNGDISEAAVYYSRDATIPCDKPVEPATKLALESRFQSLFDLPFPILVKHRDPASVDGEILTGPLRYLLLTVDFSLCYNCHTMDSGVYQTCPNCHSTTVAVFRSTTEGYHSESALSRAVRLAQERHFYY